MFINMLIIKYRVSQSWKNVPPDDYRSNKEKSACLFKCFIFAESWTNHICLQKTNLSLELCRIYISFRVVIFKFLKKCYTSFGNRQHCLQICNRICNNLNLFSISIKTTYCTNVIPQKSHGNVVLHQYLSDLNSCYC